MTVPTATPKVGDFVIYTSLWKEFEFALGEVLWRDEALALVQPANEPWKKEIVVWTRIHAAGSEQAMRNLAKRVAKLCETRTKAMSKANERTITIAGEHARRVWDLLSDSS